MTRLSRRFVLPGVAAVILLVTYTWIFHDVFTTKTPGANDFFSRWVGARQFILKGWDPYREETSLLIQNAIYGHPAKPDEDPSLFAYPFFTIFLIAPYALLPDYAWAQAAWQVTLQIVVIITLLLILRYHRWQPAPLMFGGLALWSILFYPTWRSLILGQIGVIVFALTVWAALLINRNSNPTARSDTAVGALLAISTVKPQMQFLIIPFLAIWALRLRRWYVIGSFAVITALLAGLSFLMLPTWFSEWITQVQNYPGYTPPAVLYILTHEVLNLGGIASYVEYSLDGLLVAYWLYEWFLVVWHREDFRFDWVFSLTLVITHLVAPRTATTHFIVFLFPLVMMFRDWLQQPRWGLPLVVGLMLILCFGMWALFILTLSGRQESDLVHVPLPILMLGLMICTRPKPSERAHIMGAR